MNTLNFKNISVALLITLSAMFSFNTHAAEAISIESSLGELFIAQSKQMMNELSEDLQQSITAEVNNFSLNESLATSLAWLNSDDEASVSNESGNSKLKSNQKAQNKSL